MCSAWQTIGIYLLGTVPGLFLGWVTTRNHFERVLEDQRFEAQLGHVPPRPVPAQAPIQAERGGR